METFILIIFFTAIIITFIIAFWIGNKVGEARKHREWEGQVDEIRNDAVNRSRAVLGGQFSEQLAPYLPDFKYNPSDCRFIGKPVDFIVFNGLSNGELKDVTFLEIKSGDSKLNSNQRDLKRVVESGNVNWEEYRIPKELTGKRE
ncbi:MAG: Holliday junction resolvase-like protein [Nanoarchaeota archaeon]